MTRQEALNQNKLTYSGGRPCKECGGTIRYVANRHCQPCHSKSDRDKYGPRRAEQDARRRLRQYCPLAKNDAEAIVDLYKTAAIKTMITGVKHQVDHIIPLNHPDVCGLHVSWNMDILTAEDNVRKSNNFDPTDPRVYPDLYSASQASLLNRQRKHANLRLVGSEYYAEKEALYAH